MKYFVKIFFFFQSRKTYVSELYYNAIELINCICIRWQWYFFVFFFFFPISIECDTRYRIALRNSWNSRNWSILLCSNRTKFAIIFFPRAPFLFYLLSSSFYSSFSFSFFSSTFSHHSSQLRLDPLSRSTESLYPWRTRPIDELIN